jgi:putative SOS response-associated peptidase YedK
VLKHPLYLADMHARMPAILPSGAYASWMKPAMRDARVASGWLVPYDGAKRWYPVSRSFNHAENDDAECVEPVEMQEPQQGQSFA